MSELKSSTPIIETTPTGYYPEMKFIYSKKEEKEEIQKKIDLLQDIINDLKGEQSTIDTIVETSSARLLEQMEKDNCPEFEMENLVATKYSRESIGYTSDEDVLKILKDGNYTSLISIKESISKAALKKELKTNLDLKSKLDNIIVKSTTKYVVVTTKENAEKMKVHIEENMKGK